MSASDDEVRRLVDFILRFARGKYGENVLIEPEEMTAIREAAKVAHAAWKAQSPEVFANALTGLTVGGKKLDLDALDIGDVDDIVSEEEERRRKERRAEQERKSAQATRTVLVMTAGIVGIIGFLAFQHFEKKKEPETKNDKAERQRVDRPTAKTTPTSTATVAFRAPQRVTVSSCTCISRATGKNTFVLEAPGSAIDDWYFDWNQQSGFQSMHSGFTPRASDAGAVTSLTSGATKLRAAMACENEIVAIVAGDVASAWSATDSGELLWTRKLPSPMTEPADAGTHDDVSCAEPFSITGNVFTVPLAKGKKITLSIRDGGVH